MYAKLSSLKIFAYITIITYLTVIFQRLEKYYLSVLGLSYWDKGFLGGDFVSGGEGGLEFTC